MRRGNIPSPEPVDFLGEGAPAPPPPTRPAPQPQQELRTVFEFELPRGFVDRHGTVHKRGAMRLATARDELSPMWDDRVRQNPAYLTILLLARVIVRLGTLDDDEVNQYVVEELFATDLAFLQDLYRRINTEGHTRALVACPACGEQFAVDTSGSGQGSQL
jgi:hypothetical protein